MRLSKCPTLKFSEFDVECRTLNACRAWPREGELGVCFCFLFGDIPRPDEPADQSALGRLRARGVAHDARHSDATSEERRPRRGLWRRGHGKHFWRANHQRFGEVHGMAGGYLFRAHLRIVDPLCA